MIVVRQEDLAGAFRNGLDGRASPGCPADLRAIVERHASDESDGEADPGDTHADRGALLALLSRLAQREYKTTSLGCGGPYEECLLCGAKADEGCEIVCGPDCPAPLLEVLRCPP